MTAYAFKLFPVGRWTGPAAKQQTPALHDKEIAHRRECIGEMIASRACNSEYGLLTMMAMFPQAFAEGDSDDH